MRVAHFEAVGPQLLDQVGDAEADVVAGEPEHDLRDDEPTAVVVDPLARGSLHLFVDPLQNGVVGLHRH